MGSNKLKPLNFSEDVKKYEAYEKKVDVKFVKCGHGDAEYDPTKGQLRCKCGASWSGARLGELQKLLKVAK